MKWVKHMTNARRDPKMLAVKREFGLAGVGMFWVTVEAVAEQYDAKDKNDVASLTLDLASWRELTAISPQMMRKWAKFGDETGLFSASFSEKTLTISIKKINDIRDNYTKDLQAPGKSTRARIPETEEEEEKREREGARARVDASTASRPPERFPEYSPEFLEFMDAYDEDENDGAWSAWCSVCSRYNFTAGWRETLNGWLDSEQFTKDGGRFKPSAKTFLRDGYWQRRAPRPVAQTNSQPKPHTVSDACAQERDRAADRILDDFRRQHAYPETDSCGDRQAVDCLPGGQAQRKAEGRVNGHLDGRPRQPDGSHVR